MFSRLHIPLLPRSSCCTSANMFGWGRNRQDNQSTTPAGRAQPPSKSLAAAQPGAPGLPLELVRYDADSGKFHVGVEALKALRATKDPVGVVAVCGRARQGKSFILNQLLGQSTGFQVAPSVRPCTKGLWMWSSPIRRKNADGSQYQLVRIDQLLADVSAAVSSHVYITYFCSRPGALRL